MSSIAAPLAPRGTRITVCSFTPSRIGIISSRRSKSKLAVRGVNVAGISDGSAGGGGAGLAAGVAIRTAAAPSSAVVSARASRARRRGEVRMAASIGPRATGRGAAGRAGARAGPQKRCQLVGARSSVAPAWR